MKKVFIVIACLLSIYKTAFSQISFDHLTVANGLSQSTVLSFCKDSRGYIWIGTRDRLNRYDARNIKIYNHSYKDPGSISCNDYVFSVFEDRAKNLWVGTVRGLNRYIPETDSFEHILKDSTNRNSLSDDNIHCIFQDHLGHLWVGTNNGLNMAVTSNSRKFTRFFKKDVIHPGLAGNEIQTIYEDHANNIWVGTVYGLTKMTLKNGRYLFTSFVNSETNPNSLSGNSVQAITEDAAGRLWIGTQSGGLSLYHPESGTFTNFKHDIANSNSLSSNDVRTIMVDKQNKLWVGSINGLNIYDPATGLFTFYDHDTENQNSLSNNSIKDIYLDRTGTIWIGTMYGGINIVHPYSIPFKIYRSNKFKNSISGNTVSPLIADAKDNLWIGTDGNGLNYYDKSKNQFTNYINLPANNTSISTNYVKSIYIDKENNLWIGFHQGGLDLFDPATQTFKHHKHDPANPFSISSDIVSCTLEDSQKRFWVGTALGLNIFDKKQEQFRTYINDPEHPIRLSTIAVRCIYEDSRHNIWVGTTIGLNILKDHSLAFVAFKVDERDDNSLKASYINCVTEDRSGTVWIGAYHGGLSRYNSKTNTFKTYTAAQGLPTDNVLRIEQANDGALWISTDNGLARFDPKTEKFKTFTVKDGLPINEFNANSSFRDSNGDIYFGTYNGLVGFNPKYVRDNNYAGPVIFTGLRLFNEPVQINDKTGLLKQNISLTRQLTFRHDQNVFSLDFTALNYNTPERNKFMYKLDGFEKNWNIVSIPSATYTNLPTGDYDFLIRGSNSDGLWNKHTASLHIVILPPFWKTWWAYLIYFGGFCTMLYLVVRFFRKQAKLERDLYYEHLNREKQQEIYQLKVDFFTKVSHEIRTPLSLILGPIEKIIEQAAESPIIEKQLALVKQSTDRLLRLVNELLDFRKVESGHLQLNVGEYDIVKFCRQVFDPFEQLATANNINYQFKTAVDSAYFYFDYQQFEKVLYNVLSNAFKFTPIGGEITLTIEPGQENINIIIADNGTGISAEALPHVFTNFYQDNPTPKSQGWGIGLALAKNIIELHKGDITAQSTPKTSEVSGHTVFIISLLKGSQHFSEHELLNTVNDNNDLHTDDIIVQLQNTKTLIDRPAPKGRAVVLIVEDNDDLRDFIKEALCGLYAIHEAVNGADGWERASNLIPDLIISDVAMPVMDGFEFCCRIKSDERTNHIPFIMLTAKVAQSHLVNGLKTGADVYLTKPFSVQVLELNICNLLQARERMREKYARQVTLMPQDKFIESPDEIFLNKLMQIVEGHLEDPEFDVNQLVNEIGMSQAVLYRKIKALTDLTIHDFIKTTRLKQAALLLKQNKLSIAEVAYSVGFNDRKYFSREFKKQFGKAPADYILNNPASHDEPVKG
ncbi:Two component regulator propeller [Mucilaginibacter gossypiicola]|uniref:histidine kinase n=1 Tax=Mucilaginibacter gossypiicola TaxID=551995 RepID=A0A1H8M4K2_9SPHI|nr:hybrid sensor histidine kinase/response regulator transcription factor [Mucilaginibacter gossypiicola]SEO12303.1 Two component regulator propeller [Mucilaginibacter gossypiicola]